MSGPRLQRARRAGMFFNTMYTIGVIASCLLVGATISTVVIATGVSQRGTLLPAAYTAMAGLGVLDLIGRTPSTRRQTPKRWIHQFSIGTTGVLWGLDVGSLFTTIKITSLIWAALLVALVGPAWTPLMASAAYAAAYLTAHWLTGIRVSRQAHVALPIIRLGNFPVDLVRRVAGIALVVIAATGWALSAGG